MLIDSIVIFSRLTGKSAPTIFIMRFHRGSSLPTLLSIKNTLESDENEAVLLGKLYVRLRLFIYRFSAFELT